MKYEFRQFVKPIESANTIGGFHTFKNANGINPIDLYIPQKPLRKVFMDELGEYITANKQYLLNKFNCNFSNNVLSSIGLYLLNHLDYDKLIEYDSMQLMDNKCFDLFLSDYFNHWGR